MPSNNRKKPPDRGGEGRHNESVATQTTEHYPPVLGRNRRGRCGWKSVTALSLLVAALAVFAGRIVNSVIMERHFIEQMEEMIGEGLTVFKAYDRDGDGYLNIIEFEPLLEKLNIEDSIERGDHSYGDENIDPAEEVLTVEAAFSPLLQDTMSKTKEPSFLSYKAPLATLDAWQEPTERITAFPVSSFRPFLPEDGASVGDPYTIIKSKLNLFTSQLSSNRYFPPRAKGREVIVHRLLNVFHPRPFVHTRFGPQGSVAVIRAMSANYVDIVFRIHGEFQLNEPPKHPFWFTPAQFTGHLTMKKDASHIQDFHLYVPANRTLNVDMEWMNGPNEVENMEVDIGFMPKMELTVTGPSSQVTIYSETGEVIYEPSSKDTVTMETGEDIVWDEEISEEEAFAALERHLYPFKKVEYFPLKDAVKKAELDNKLVHHILLWGALDDQSC